MMGISAALCYMLVEVFLHVTLFAVHNLHIQKHYKILQKYEVPLVICFLNVNDI